MAAPAKINALDMLRGIQGVDENKVKAAAEQQALHFAKEVEPDDPYLIHPYEGDYVTGVELKTPNGKAIKPETLAAMLKRGVNISLVGPAGAGKSALAFHIVDIINEKTRKENQRIHAENTQLAKDGKALKPYKELLYPMWHVSCHEATRSEDLTVGSKVRVSNGVAESLEIMGAAVGAYTLGGILAIEEWDHSMPGVLSEMHQLLDGRTQMVRFYVDGPKKYIRHPLFLGAIATSNSKGMGEANKDYAGTQMQNRAFRSRFGFTVEVPFLPATVEIEALMKLGLPNQMASKMVGIATKIREAAEANEFDMEFSLRDLKHWALATLQFCENAGIKIDATRAWQEAIEASYPAFLSREDKTTADGVFKYVNIA